MGSLANAASMVYFECSKCNETVKKPKLAKHLMSCRSQYVSCIDCSKVFAWNEWEAHTSCMSEAQKYQGKLYQAKDSSNKGQVKQESWIENVEKAIADPASGVAPQTRSLLEKLMGFSNIPRKQKPFGNFVKNSLNIWDDKRINDMWDVIAAASKPAAPAAAAPAAAKPPEPEAEPEVDAVKKPAAKKWAGWKRALDDELASAGGSMPWKKLQTALTKQYVESGQPAYEETHLANLALASIPEGYLSKSSEMVTLPAS